MATTDAETGPSKPSKSAGGCAPSFEILREGHHNHEREALAGHHGGRQRRTGCTSPPGLPVSVIYAPDSRPDNALKAPPAVVYDEDHGPDQRDSHADFRLVQGVDGDRIPSEWLRGVANLDPAWAPRDVPSHRWRQLVSDCTEFVVSKWAERAAVLGWDTVSLFGCHQRPVDFFGIAGLVWHFAGGKLIALRKDWAVIAAAGGAERTYHRRPAAANVTLPWKLG